MSLEGPAEARWRWLGSLGDGAEERLVAMINRVVEVDTTVGLARPMSADEAQAFAADLDEDLRAGRSHLLVVETAEAIMGSLLLVPHRSPNNRHLGTVYRAMLEPSVRGIGLVRRGMVELADRCDELGVEVLVIDVRRGTPAEPIWTHLGFEVFGVLPDYSRVEGESFDGLYMFQRVEQLRARAVRGAVE